MRSEYGQALRRVVEQRMRKSAFGWEVVRLKSPYVFPGERLFKRSGGNGVLFWCVLVPHEKLEQFTFELGWSVLGRFPELGVRPSPVEPSRALQLGEYFVRLGTLVSGEDKWWQVEPFAAANSVEQIMASMQRMPAEEARSRVEPVAVDALAALESFGVPYLQRFPA